MKLHTKLMLGLLSALFAASFAMATEHGTKMSPRHPGIDCNGMGMMSGDMKTDPVARAHKRLSELKAQLNLAADQQPAWQAFSDHVNDQAKNMASMRDRMKSNAQSMPKTAPEQMAKMADLMKERAQNMARMADAAKTFYATLTSEQKVAFDKVYTGQMARMPRAGPGLKD